MINWVPKYVATMLWAMVAEHDCALYEAELEWLRRLSDALAGGTAG